MKGVVIVISLDRTTSVLLLLYLPVFRFDIPYLDSNY